jgi:hypothetical protein
MIQRLLPLGGILCATALLGACGPGHEWSHASSLNTVAAYQKFLSEYPTDPHAADAQSRIATLQDERAWATAQIASTVAGYQQYVTAEPNGAHVQAARDEIVTRERDAAWQTAQTHPTAESLREFINKFPSSSEADEAREKLETIAGYRAELGAARSERLARRERDALERRFGKDLRQVVILEPDAKDPEYRITSAPMSEQDASAACETLQRSGRSCKVVQTAG